MAQKTGYSKGSLCRNSTTAYSGQKLQVKCALRQPCMLIWELSSLIYVPNIHQILNDLGQKMGWTQQIPRIQGAFKRFFFWILLVKTKTILILREAYFASVLTTCRAILYLQVVSWYSMPWMLQCILVQCREIHNTIYYWTATYSRESWGKL